MTTPVTRAFAAAASLALAACTVIIPGEPKPTPTPIVTNPCLADERPEVHLWVAVRMDRTTVNLAETYGTFIRALPVALLKMGARPTRVAIFALDEHHGRQQPLAAAGCGVGGSELDPGQVLAEYARLAPPREAGDACAVTPLVEAGAALTDLVTDYPPEIPGESGKRVFGGAPPAAVIVLYLDSLSRSAGFEESACADAARLAASNGEGAAWLGYAEPVPMARVYHWMISTEEGVTVEAFEAACRKIEGVRVDAIDVLEPSPRRLYDPLASAIGAAGGPAARGGMCALLSEAGQREFFGARLAELASALDLDVTALGDSVLDTELPGTGEPTTEPR